MKKKGKFPKKTDLRDLYLDCSLNVNRPPSHGVKGNVGGRPLLYIRQSNQGRLVDSEKIGHKKKGRRAIEVATHLPEI